MSMLKSYLKSVLPPKASFLLRSVKARMVDSDTRMFEQIIQCFGDKRSMAIDVGANFGIYSAVMSKAFHSVLCVEPNPRCVAYMRRVLPNNCQVFPYAISDRAGVASLRVPILNGHDETTRATISSLNVFGMAEPPAFHTFEVATMTIDALLQQAGVLKEDVVFLKIDTEGHEYASWKGAAATIRLQTPSLCLEIERQHGDEAMSLMTEIRAEGYIAVRLEGGGLVEDKRFAVGQFGEILDEGVTANRFFIHSGKINLLKR